jgi:hypothetical protein
MDWINNLLEAARKVAESGESDERYYMSEGMRYSIPGDCYDALRAAVTLADSQRDDE